MSEGRLAEDVPEMEVAAQFDEALSQGQPESVAATHLDPGLSGLIRDLRAQKGRESIAAPANNLAASAERHYGRLRLIRRLGAGISKTPRDR